MVKVRVASVRFLFDSKSVIMSLAAPYSLKKSKFINFLGTGLEKKEVRVFCLMGKTGINQ